MITFYGNFHIVVQTQHNHSRKVIHQACDSVHWIFYCKLLKLVSGKNWLNNSLGNLIMLANINNPGLCLQRTYKFSSVEDGLVMIAETIFSLKSSHSPKAFCWRTDSNKLFSSAMSFLPIIFTVIICFSTISFFSMSQNQFFLLCNFWTNCPK